MYIRLPDNSTVELTYYKQLESRIKWSNKSTKKVNTIYDKKPSNNILYKKSITAFRANITHSCDSYVLKNLIANSKHKILPIHDCFMIKPLFRGIIEHNYIENFIYLHSNFYIETDLFFKNINEPQSFIECTKKNNDCIVSRDVINNYQSKIKFWNKLSIKIKDANYILYF
jgi:hypothetical protein